MFITLEGIDGSGKTSVVKPLLKYLQEKKYQVIVTREPGGTKISEEIRNVILQNRDESMDAWTEALLFIASRRQHLVDVIIPNLKNNYIVICDRYMDSTSAYQGSGRGLSVDAIDEIQHTVLGQWVPDLTIYFDIDIKTANERVNSRVESKNRLDQENNDYKQKVLSGYQELLAKHPQRIKSINARLSQENVLKEVIRLVDGFINDQK